MIVLHIEAEEALSEAEREWLRGMPDDLPPGVPRWRQDQVLALFTVLDEQTAVQRRFVSPPVASIRPGSRIGIQGWTAAQAIPQHDPDEPPSLEAAYRLVHD